MIEGLEIKGARHQVTLPIATVLLMLDGVPKEKPHFIKLWEKHSGTTVDAALTMGQLRPYELTAPALRYPPSFFAGSRKPFQIIGRLYQKNIPEMEKAVLPCHPGTPCGSFTNSWKIPFLKVEISLWFLFSLVWE